MFFFNTRFFYFFDVFSSSAVFFSYPLFFILMFQRIFVHYIEQFIQKRKPVILRLLVIVEKETHAARLLRPSVAVDVGLVCLETECLLQVDLMLFSIALHCHHAVCHHQVLSCFLSVVPLTYVPPGSMSMR